MSICLVLELSLSDSIIPMHPWLSSNTIVAPSDHIPTSANNWRSHTNSRQAWAAVTYSASGDEMATVFVSYLTMLLAYYPRQICTHWLIFGPSFHFPNLHPRNILTLVYPLLIVSVSCHVSRTDTSSLV
jgi:hypothetical protein